MVASPCYAQPMWRIVAFLLLGPVYVAVAWGIYVVAKLGASFIVASPIDQAAMAFLASATLTGLGIALVSTMDD
jgi:hypothetical protein